MSDPKRPTGQVTGVVTQAQIEADKAQHLAEIEAKRQIELARIAAGERTSLSEALIAARPILLGLAALAVMALAVYLGRTLHLFGVGSTGDAIVLPAPQDTP